MYEDLTFVMFGNDMLHWSFKWENEPTCGL